MSELHKQIMVRYPHITISCFGDLGCSEWKNWIEEESLDMK